MEILRLYLKIKLVVLFFFSNILSLSGSAALATTAELSWYHHGLCCCPAAEKAHPTPAAAELGKLRLICTQSILIWQSVKSNTSFLAFETKMDNLSKKDVISHQ